MGLFDASKALALLPAEDFAVLTGSLSVSEVDALSFVVQLALCLRHAHRVLQATGSALSRALLCTVYVNLPALSAAARRGLSEGFVQHLTQALITVMDEADRESEAGTAGAPGAGGYRSRFDDPSDDEVS